MEQTIEELARHVCESLQRNDARGRTIGIKVRLDDWTNVSRAKTIDQPTNDTAQVASLARELLRAYDPPRPVRLLGVRIASFEEPNRRAEAENDADEERVGAEAAQLTLSVES
jgi:DNA polymerase-4